MRILYLNPSGTMGGAETSLLEVLRSLGFAATHWTLRLLLGEGGPFAAKAESLGVGVDVLPFPRSLALAGDHGVAGFGAALTACGAAVGAARYLGPLRNRIREFHPDV